MNDFIGNDVCINYWFVGNIRSLSLLHLCCLYIEISLGLYCVLDTELN